MNLSKRDKGLLLGLVGVLLIAASYFFMYKPSMEKKVELEAQLATIQKHEAELVNLENNMDFYLSEIDRLEGEKEVFLACFPADIKEESEIMYAVELENTVDIKFSSLSYGSDITVLGSDATDSANATLAGYCVPMTMAYETSYAGLKNTILHTKQHQNRMVIDAVTASFDSTTGYLSGSMTLNQFYIAGTENAYQEPYVPTLEIGLPNIFGTIK